MAEFPDRQPTALQSRLKTPSIEINGISQVLGVLDRASDLQWKKERRDSMFKWKFAQDDSSVSESATQPALAEPPAPAVAPQAQSAASSSGLTIISKGQVFRGEITGTESLLIEGRVEGSIQLDGHRVTVAHGADVSARIVAREVVVMGELRGTVSATDRVEIRTQGVLVGDVTSPRIIIENGACLKGNLHTNKPEPILEFRTKSAMQMPETTKRAQPKALPARYAGRVHQAFQVGDSMARVPPMNDLMAVRDEVANLVH